MTDPITYFKMGKERITVRESELVDPDEAYLVIDTNNLAMSFQRQLFHHINKGNIKVCHLQVGEVSDAVL
jgi:hypothetical protein